MDKAQITQIPLKNAIGNNVVPNANELPITSLLEIMWSWGNDRIANHPHTAIPMALIASQPRDSRKVSRKKFVRFMCVE